MAFKLYMTENTLRCFFPRIMGGDITPRLTQNAPTPRIMCMFLESALRCPFPRIAGGDITPRLTQRTPIPRIMCLLPTEYFEQSYVPLVNKEVVDAIGTLETDVTIIPENTVAADGLLFSDDSKAEKAFLVILGTAVNMYFGDNYLTGGIGKNVWQMAINDGAWQDLYPDGEMVDGSWQAKENGIPSFALSFNITDIFTNTDGRIGLRIKSAMAAQDFFVPEVSAGLKILWRG